MVAAARGYRCVIVMPEGYGHVKAKLMAGARRRGRAHAGRRDDESARSSARRQIAEKTAGAFVPDQFHNPVNP